MILSFLYIFSPPPPSLVYICFVDIDIVICIAICYITIQSISYIIYNNDAYDMYYYTILYHVQYTYAYAYVTNVYHICILLNHPPPSLVLPAGTLTDCLSRAHSVHYRPTVELAGIRVVVGRTIHPHQRMREYQPYLCLCFCHLVFVYF